MLSGLRGLVAAVLLFATASLALAKCNPSADPDKSDIANARAAAARVCDCATAASHADYVSCVTKEAALALQNKSCIGVVKRCARKSTCGEPGSVTCCRTGSGGKTSCAIKSNAGKCVAPRGGAACVGSFASCCDACSNGGCATTTTTTIPSGCTSMPFPSCGGTCPDGGVCGPRFDFTGCQCNEPTSPCGDTAPVCNGTCASGDKCVALGPGPLNACGCIPEGSTPCGSPGAPICGGVCPGSFVCRAGFQLPVFGGGVGCFCTRPGQCGQGGADCPNGFGCAVQPPNPMAFCAPVGCGSNPSYPTCAGTCVQGAECVALSVNASFHTCLCAVAGSCDAGCGAYDCPSAQVCGVSTGGQLSCACGAP